MTLPPPPPPLSPPPINLSPCWNLLLVLRVEKEPTLAIQPSSAFICSVLYVCVCNAFASGRSPTTSLSSHLIQTVLLLLLLLLLLSEVCSRTDQHIYLLPSSLYLSFPPFSFPSIPPLLASYILYFSPPVSVLP